MVSGQKDKGRVDIKMPCQGPNLDRAVKYRVEIPHPYYTARMWTMQAVRREYP